MIHGRDTLNAIENALLTEQTKVVDTDNHIAQASEHLIQLRTEQSTDFKALASLKVDAIAAGKITSRLDKVEQQVLNLLQARKGTIADLERAIEHSKHAQKPIEEERAQQAEKLEQAALTLDEAESATQQRLDADPAYQAQHEKTTEAERTAAHANDKATLSEQNLEEKGEPYRNDPLFIYLWERHYGTGDYSANPLVRFLDGKVAKLIKYADARPNYHRLQEIPLRLREHADLVQAEASTEFDKLRDWDTKARKQDGVTALEEELKKQTDVLEKIDERIDDAADKLQQQLQQKTDFATGEDEDYLKIVKYLSMELSHDELHDLRQEAYATPLLEDDEIVHRLMDKEEQQHNLEQLLLDLKKGIRLHQQRQQEIELLRRDFKRNHFDQMGSGFADGALVSIALANFLNGELDRGALLRVFETQQRFIRYRSNPRFGSGGFGRGTVWGGSVRIPSGRGGFGGGFGGGGFSTGGGFGGGGGGFSSGGGF